MIIAIFLMAEAWILNLSYAFVDEQSVINYVSFASTITSLILAILAIIYGFYQSENGKKTNSALENNIDSLQATQRKFDEFINSVDVQLTSINESADTLKVVGSTFSRSVDKIEEIRKEVFDINKNHQKNHDDITSLFRDTLKNFTPTNNDSNSKFFNDQVLSSIFQKSSFMLDLISVLLVEAYDAKYEGDALNLVFDNFATPVHEVIQAGSDGVDIQSMSNFNKYTLSRYSLDILYVSNALGLINFDDNKKIKFIPEVIEKIRKYAASAKSVKSTKTFAEKIASSFVS